MTDETRTEWVPISHSTSENLYVEVAMSGGRTQVGLLDAIPIDRVISLVSEVAYAMGKAIERVSPTKSAVEVGFEFGLREGQLVGLIARGSSKANFKITLEWDRSKGQ